jgi:hypothetical protein
MNIHSVMPVNALARKTRASTPDPPPGPKRDAILRAAIDIFAERGYFNAQVADVARAAGVAGPSLISGARTTSSSPFSSAACARD